MQDHNCVMKSAPPWRSEQVIEREYCLRDHSDSMTCPSFRGCRYRFTRTMENENVTRMPMAAVFAVPLCPSNTIYTYNSTRRYPPTNATTAIQALIP
eukprot:5390083-Amphidinium_carterae.1